MTHLFRKGDVVTFNHPSEWARQFNPIASTIQRRRKGMVLVHFARSHGWDRIWLTTSPPDTMTDLRRVKCPPKSP